MWPERTTGCTREASQASRRRLGRIRTRRLGSSLSLGIGPVCDWACRATRHRSRAPPSRAQGKKDAPLALVWRLCHNQAHGVSKREKENMNVVKVCLTITNKCVPPRRALACLLARR